MFFRFSQQNFCASLLCCPVLLRTLTPHVFLGYKKTQRQWSEVAQSCPTLCDLIDCSLPGSSVPGIFQARVLEWLAIPFSRGSSWYRDWTQISHIVGRHFTIWAPRGVGHTYQREPQIDATALAVIMMKQRQTVLSRFSNGLPVLPILRQCWRNNDTVV